MPVSMMSIRDVRVLVFQGRMRVYVRMDVAERVGRTVGVLVVLVVRMDMLMD